MRMMSSCVLSSSQHPQSLLPCCRCPWHDPSRPSRQSLTLSLTWPSQLESLSRPLSPSRRQIDCDCDCSTAWHQWQQWSPTVDCATSSRAARLPSDPSKQRRFHGHRRSWTSKPLDLSESWHGRPLVTRRGRASRGTWTVKRRRPWRPTEPCPSSPWNWRPMTESWSRWWRWRRRT